MLASSTAVFLLASFRLSYKKVGYIFKVQNIVSKFFKNAIFKLYITLNTSVYDDKTKCCKPMFVHALVCTI